MLQIFGKTLKERRLSLVIYSLISVLFIWMYVSIFPSMRDQAEEFNKLMEVYPESLMKAFGIEETGMFFSKLENFLSVENFSLIWPILVIAMMVAMGGYSIAGEVEQGTIETLVSQPISRIKIFFGKYLAGLANLFVFTVVSIFSTFPLAKFYDISYETANYLTLSAIGFLFGWAIFSIATLLSVIFNEKGKSYFITTGLVVIMYAVKIISSLKDNLEDLKYISFFYYYDSAEALIKNDVPAISYLVFGGVIIVFTLLAIKAFNRKNITVP